MGHIALFAIHHTEGDVWISEWAKLKEWADHLILDVVPLIHEGKTTGGAEMGAIRNIAESMGVPVFEVTPDTPCVVLVRRRQSMQQIKRVTNF